MSAASLGALLFVAASAGALFWFVREHTQRLQQRANRSDALLRTSAQIIWAADPSGNMLQLSESFQRLTGLSLDSARNRGWFDAVHTDDRQRARAAWDRAIETRSTLDFECRLKSVDGSYRYFQFHGMPMYDGGGFLNEWLGTAIDMHERASAERSSREDADRLRMILDGEPVMVSVVSVDGVLMEVNETAAQIAGASRTALVGKPLADANWWGYAERAQTWARSAVKAAATGKPLRADVMMRGPGERIGWYDFSIAPARDGAGKITHLVTVAIDIAKRKQLEMDLRESEENLRLCVDGGNVGLWDWDLASGEVRYSKRWKQHIGYADEDIANTMDAFWPLVHPEDRTRVSSKIEEYRRAGKGDYVDELRMRHKDGSYRWILTQASLLKDGEGHPVRMLGAHVDITDRKHAEEDANVRARRQAEIASLGIDALANLALAEVMKRAARVVAEMLGCEFTQVLEMLPDGQHLLLRAGEGWPAGSVGRLELDGGRNSHGGYVMLANEPVVIVDLAQERRFIVEPLLLKSGVISGVCTLLHGRGGNYGVLAAYARTRRQFSDDDINFLQSIANVVANAIEKSRHENQLFQLAHHDEITGLPNRRFMHSRMSQMLIEGQQHNERAALMMFDLDNFKTINNRYGHAAADELLRAVGERVGVCLNPGDTLCRLGEDEFAIILYPIAGTDWVTTVAQTVLGLFEEPFAIGTNEAFTTVSIGIAVSSPTTLDAEAMVREAGIALNHSKQSGRNCFRFFNADMEKETQRWAALQSALHRAVVQDEFRLVYQPQVDLATGRIVGAEALLRWRSAELGEVSPREFLPVAESSGLIDTIGRYVMRAGCLQAKEWAAIGSTGMRVSINLSARQFRRPDLTERMLEAVRQHGVDPKAIELEVAEGIITESIEEAATRVDALKNAGFRIAIDDVGSDLSSLNQFKNLHVDALKINRSFIQNLATNPDDAAIAKSIINVAHSVGLSVVAVGVETEAQLNFLRRNGCNAGQGLFFSQIVPAAEITSMVVTGRVLRRTSSITAGGLR
jgi:diguanylate cyclase (GGDEF)-like protein/PAS domain S-box-containing protein